MEVTVLVHGEEITEAAFGHFENSILNRGKFVLDVGIVAGQLIERLQNLKSFVLAALENEPAGRLGKTHDRGEDDERKEDLEGDWEAPGGLIGSCKGHAEVDPV